MKVKFSKTFLTIWMLTTLAACGSGGGSGDGSTNPTTSQSIGTTGGMYTISTNEDGDIQSITSKTLNSTNINSIGLDATSTQRINDALEQMKNSFTLKNGIQVTGGAAIVSNGTDKLYIIYNGNPTDVMPTVGTINYKGTSALVKGSDDDIKLGSGTSTFSVNLSNKTLTGSLNVNNFAPVSITGNVSRNNFTGQATSSDIPGGAQIEGKFYGENAAGLAGILKSNTLNDYQGTLGVFAAVDETKSVQ